MAKANQANITKKQAREAIEQALGSLTFLQTALGKKKFQKRLQKAEKMLSNGLPKKLKKVPAPAFENEPGQP